MFQMLYKGMANIYMANELNHILIGLMRNTLTIK